MPYLLGIDLSTTAAKALLIDENGTRVASASQPLELSSPHPLWSEQRPQDWWSAARASIRQVLQESAVDPDAITAVGLTGQMHGLVLLDEAARVLRPAILWNDQRTGEQCDQIRERLGGRQRLIEISGNDALTGFTAPKILWVRQHEPGVYARIRHILLPKDYIRYMLTGDFALDRAGGSGTLLFDLQQRSWSDDLLAALEIPAKWLPHTYEGTQVTGVINVAAHQETGLKVGTPVVAGGGDQSAQAVGVGAVAPGIAALTLGTSGVVFAPTSEPLIEPQGRLHAFCHAVPGMWHLMGVMLSAAGSLQWYRDALAPGTAYEDLLAEAAAVPPGADGLLFLPYLSGERTPHPDPYARGAWIGLTRRHSRGHLTRAVLEGVACGLKDSFTLLSQAGLGAIEQVRLSGGGARSPLWRQILADVLEVALMSVRQQEGAAYGAALLAGVGGRLWPTVPAACRQLVHTTGSTRPDPESSQRYAAVYERYRALYPRLQDEFPRLHALGSS